jgi:hypothetical protein
VTTQRRAERTLQRVRSSDLLKNIARLGLVARGCFYLLLAYLAAAVAVGWGQDARQANAHGALTTVAEKPFGLVALVLAAAGFLGFGVARLAGALGDRSIGRLRRLSTAGQGAFYLLMAATTASFLVGRRSTGSSGQQRGTVIAVLSSPGGRVVLATTGIAVVAICTWQVRLAVQGGYADSLRTHEMGRRTRRAARVLGPVGIIARALAVVPIGALLVAAALTDQARRAKDLDQLLLLLRQTTAGRGVVWVVAAGFAVFAAYSLLEARYRSADSGD